jgi:YD repeat-containing protein
VHHALDYIGSLLSQGRICFRATLGASSPSPHSTAHRRWKALSLAALGVLCLSLSSVAPESQAGQERYEYDPIGRLIRYLDTNNQVTEYTYDAAGNILSVVKGGAASGYIPSLTSVTPNFIRRGEVKSIALAGLRLQVGTLQTSDAALDLGNVRQNATQILADLTAGATAAVGAQTLTFANAEGSASIGITVGPLLPTMAVEPSPLALPPDNLSHSITVRLSSADLLGHQIAISSSDVTKATVSPAFVTLAAGQTSAQLSVTSKTAGFVNLVLTSTTLGTVSVPVFITADFRGVNTSQALPVGIVVGDAQPPVTGPSAIGTFVSPRVGIAVGSVITDLVPQAWPVGSSGTLVIRGANIPATAQVSVQPATGLTLGVPTVAADGSQMSVPISIDAAAVSGGRRLLVSDGLNLIPYAASSKSHLVLTTGQPTITSLEPLFAKPGTTVRLTVRGRNLQNGRFALAPGVDLRVDSQPVISADGTELVTNVQIAPLAATGPRTAQVTTPSAESSSQATFANQFTLVSDITGSIGPIFAPPVGIVVGADATMPTSQTIAPVISPMVGIAVGAFAKSMTPTVGVIGTAVNVVVTGQGLQAVQSARLTANTGLTLGALTVNAEGTELSIPVTMDATAPKTPRKLVLSTAAGPLSFADANGGNFLVAAPAPELASVAPQVLKAGQTGGFTLRGVNFRDVVAVRFEPAQGLSTPSALTASADGTVLNLTVAAATNAASGPRTVIVVTAGGESTAVQVPANTLNVAQQTGPTYADIMAPTVGVNVGVVTPQPVASVLDIYAAAVGVMVTESPPAAVTVSVLAVSTDVSVIVGSAITSMNPVQPDGFQKGTSGVIVFTGVGLDKVTSAGARGTSAVTVGALAVNAAGTELTVPVAIDSAAVSGTYGVNLFTGTGASTAKLAAANLTIYGFAVGALPSLIESVTPIVLEQGKSYTFTVRGVGLKDVYQMTTAPTAGVSFATDANPVVWSTDALGEKLTARIFISSDAAIGSRAVRLRVPGALTDASAVPANTITIVAPQ